MKTLSVGEYTYDAPFATYIYDIWAMISEISYLPSEMQTNQSWFVYGLDRSGTLQGAGGIGGLLAAHIFPRPTGGEGQGEGITAFYCYDANHEYAPHDNLTLQSDSEASQNPINSSSKYLYNETSLYYYGYRYYMPETGRWLSRDPIGEMGGNNLCAAFANNPVNFVDVMGLAGCCKCKSIAATKTGTGVKEVHPDGSVTIYAAKITATVTYEGDSDGCKCKTVELGIAVAKRTNPLFSKTEVYNDEQAFSCFGGFEDNPNVSLGATLKLSPPRPWSAKWDLSQTYTCVGNDGSSASASQDIKISMSFTY